MKRRYGIIFEGCTNLWALDFNEDIFPMENKNVISINMHELFLIPVKNQSLRMFSCKTSLLFHGDFLSFAEWPPCFQFADSSNNIYVTNFHNRTFLRSKIKFTVV